MSKIENSDAIKQGGELLNFLKDVKRLVSNPENRDDLEQLLQMEMERVGFLFDALDINQEHIFHYPKFVEVIECFETNLPILAHLMYVVGKSGKDQEIDCIINFIKDRTHQAIKSFDEVNRDTVYLKLLPLVAVVTGYGLGLLSSQRLQIFHKFFETKLSAMDFNSRVRIVDYLFPHLWKGREIRLWKYQLPKLKEPFLLQSDAYKLLLTKISFLDYFDRKIKVWLNSELGEEIDFRSLVCNFKVLGSLIFLEKFEYNKFKNNLYNDGNFDISYFNFEFNEDFFYTEINLIDQILTKEYLERLTEVGFKRMSESMLNLFKQFYVELHYLPEYWSDMDLNTEFYTLDAKENEAVRKEL